MAWRGVACDGVGVIDGVIVGVIVGVVGVVVFVVDVSN